MIFLVSKGKRFTQFGPKIICFERKRNAWQNDSETKLLSQKQFVFEEDGRGGESARNIKKI